MMRLIIATTALCLASPLFGQAKDRPPGALSYARNMTHDRGESWTYRKPDLDLGGYDSIIVENGTVYTGPDAQFDDVSRADRPRYAAIMTDAVRSELRKSFSVVTAAAPKTLRLKLVLVGVDGTKGGVATATRVMPIGFALSAVKSVAGKPGSLTGSVLYAIELLDSQTGSLMVAAVRRGAPDALDIPATLSTTDTVKAVAQDVAKQLREKLEHATGRPS